MTHARPITPPTLPLLVMAILVVELTVVTSVYRAAQTPILLAAFAADAVLLSAFVIWRAARRAGGVAALRIAWPRVIKTALLLTVAAAIAARIAGMPVSGGFLLLVASAEVAVVITVVWTLVRAMRAARGPGAMDEVRRRLSRVLPAPVVEVAAGELELAGAAVRALWRAPLPELDGYTSTRTSQSGFLVPVALLLTLIEAPALHALIYFWLGSGHAALHTALLLLNAYGILWLLGDRRLMQERAHRFEAQGLALALGARVRGVVPYAAMDRVIRLDPGRRPEPRRLTRTVSPYDAPNVHLCLKSPVVLRTYFGLPVKAQHLDLYLDAPDAFVEELVRRCAGR